MIDIGIPEELKDDENILKLLTILFPCTIKKIRSTEQTRGREMLIDTFRENCAKKRIDFFKDPLVKYLWNKVFMEEKPEVF